MAGPSCCGGGCCKSSQSGSHAHGARGRGGSSAGWISISAGIIFGFVALAGGIALVRQPEAAPTPAPTTSAPANPATQPAAEAPKPPHMQGVIRHGRPDPIAKAPGAIRLATYNIENLFDKELPADETGSGTPPKPAAHRQAVAEAIKKVDADILAVQEIESKETLTKFRDEYLKGLGYDHVASIDAGDGRGIEQSVLSRFPLEGAEVWLHADLGAVQPDKIGNKPNKNAGKPMAWKRSPLKVTVKVPADRAGGSPKDLTLFVVHHKSGALFSFEREAEGAKAAALASDFVKSNPDHLVAIVGDFNARPREKSVQAYLSAGFTDAMGDLIPATGNEPAAWVSHVSGRTIDHILLSPAAKAAVVPETRFVLGTIQRPEGVDWRRTEPPEGYGSDHYPVVVDLRLTGTSPSPADPTSADKPAH